MKANLSEPEFINAIASREPNAASLLYDQYASKLFKIICCSVKDLQTAEAILEKTLHTIWHNANDFHLQDKQLLLWMAGIARKLARQANG